MLVSEKAIEACPISLRDMTPMRDVPPFPVIIEYYYQVQDWGLKTHGIFLTASAIADMVAEEFGRHSNDHVHISEIFELYARVIGPVDVGPSKSSPFAFPFGKMSENSPQIVGGISEDVFIGLAGCHEQKQTSSNDAITQPVAAHSQTGSVNQPVSVHPNAIYTVDEVAKILRISLSIAHSLTESGNISCMRIGQGRGTKRVKGNDLIVFMDSSKKTRHRSKMQLKHLK